MPPVALVTGAGRRVGQAIALGLARAGFDIAVHYRKSAEGARRTVEGARSAGRRAAAFRADLRREAAIRRMVARVARAFGAIDLVVLSAATFERRSIAAMEARALDEMLAVNLRAPFLVVREALAHLAEGAQIIAIADVGGTLAWPGYSHYCASKAGLIAMTRCLAVELAPRVRVNAVAPSTVLWSKSATAAQRRRTLARIPLGRVGRPSDVANTVVFLATGPRFITGHVLAVDGGRSAYCGGP
jgi:pteridine reductase